MKFVPVNPFGMSAYLGAEYFCDRDEEVKKMTDLVVNGNSITLFSLRRLGKTGLIHHFFANIPDGIKTMYVDIMNTSSTDDFLDALATSLMSQLPQRVGFGKKVWNFILSLRPTINFDPLSGMPQASFSADGVKAEQNIEAIFNFIEMQNVKTVIAIDDFQQITDYPNRNVDGWLRTQFQRLKNIEFIFSGSKQHIMLEMFNSPQRPFYRSTNMMKLEKISKESYQDFIIKMFAQYKKNISSDIAAQILDWTDRHTFYVQQLCNRVFMSGGRTITEKDWKMQANQLLQEQQEVIYSMRQLLTKNQWLLLKAIASSDVVSQPSSQAFATKYGLPGSASVLKALTYLVDKGIVYKDYDLDGKSYYAVYDLYLRRWCQNKINP